MGRFDIYLAKIAELRAILDARIIGQAELKDSLINCLLAGGLGREENSHILLCSVPGLGKSTAAKVFAAAFSLQYKRVQFKIDEMPKDFFFSWKQDSKTGIWEQHEGAIFANLLLLDEINRAHPDTHGGLLEALAEGQFTEQGQTFFVPQPFMAIGTFNPVEQRGTYTFLEALKDRFTMQITISYPTREEARLIQEMHERGVFPQPKPLCDVQDIFSMRKVIQEEVEVPQRVKEIIGGCVEASRPENNPELDSKVKLGLSPRASIWLTRVSKVVAFREGRHFVLPRDIEKIAVAVLMHRIVLSDELTSILTPFELEREAHNVVRAILKKAFVFAGEQ